ncbi:MAG: SusD/RagB family nutrient-binding outer membrane lipoprotein [Bacteroidetes bacterium]|nr:SusD/RagB family nutrient-binding outer membrane lipoprotein [Bacteroidota bacterium]
MKKINFKLIGLMVLVILTLGSCKKWIDTGINKVPDSPDDAPMFTLLASIEANMAYNTIGGTDINMPTCIWIQQLHGIARQGASEGIYIWRDGDVNNQWNTNYSRTMIDIYTMLNKARTAKHPYYTGIGEVLMAYSLGITTDVWNDIPYTEAFLGQDNLAPKFDTQDTIYVKIKGLLDDAINNQLNQTYADIPKQDVIYAGDPALWLKAAYALRARFALHLSKIRGNQAYVDALADIPNAFAANADDMLVPFPGTPGQQNPFFQFMDQRTDAAMDSVFIENLKTGVAGVDPRLTVYALPTPAGDYVGAGWEYAGEDVSAPGPAFADAAAPVQFITYAECLFIKTECEFKTGVAEATVQTDLVSAVSASMDKWGVLDPVYMHVYDSVAKTLSGAALFHEIMYQKYVALVYQAEAFNDWRRTDNVIGLNPNPHGSLNNIPRRFPYSTDEKSYNPNTPKNVTISDRVWWDALVSK